MNFKKLSKEKRKQLALAVVGSVAVVATLGYFLIQGSYQQLGRLGQKKTEAQAKLDQMQKAVQQSKTLESAFNDAKSALADKEKSMASGDLYSWMHSTIRNFQRSYKVQIPQIGSATPPANVDLIPNFPYKQSTVTIAGTAFYHDIGQFVAGFENDFPLMRIINLSLEQNATPTTTDRDKLAFKMDIVALVKND